MQPDQLPTHTITLEEYRALGGFPVKAESGFKYDNHDVSGGSLPASAPSKHYNYVSRKRSPVHYAD